MKACDIISGIKFPKSKGEGAVKPSGFHSTTFPFHQKGYKAFETLRVSYQCSVRDDKETEM